MPPRSDLFSTWLDRLEARLLPRNNRPYLTGDNFTEADLRFVSNTFIAHDPVYYIRMKLNERQDSGLSPTCGAGSCPGSIALPGRRQTAIHWNTVARGILERSWNKSFRLGPFRPMTYPEGLLHSWFGKNELGKQKGFKNDKSRCEPTFAVEPRS